VTLHPQLGAVVREFEDATARLERLAAATPPQWWTRRADPASWSVAECVAHLNLTARAFIPLVGEGLAEARRLGGPAPRRYRRDPIGWLLWRTAGPPVRIRVRTTAPFVPEALGPVSAMLETFAEDQARQIQAVRRADGLPLGQVRIASPFDPRLRYNLYACLTILPRHQHRHLWQAERVLARLGSAG
jgi:hypothetical protein